MISFARFYLALPLFIASSVFLFRVCTPTHSVMEKVLFSAKIFVIVQKFVFSHFTSRRVHSVFHLFIHFQSFETVKCKKATTKSATAQKSLNHFYYVNLYIFFFVFVSVMLSISMNLMRVLLKVPKQQMAIVGYVFIVRVWMCACVRELERARVLLATMLCRNVVSMVFTCMRNADMFIIAIKEWHCSTVLCFHMKHINWLMDL